MNTTKTNRFVTRLLVVMGLTLALLPFAPATAFAASPPATLTGRFVLDSNFTCNSSYSGSTNGFPGTVTLDGGYTVASFGMDGANRRIACASPGAANWGDPSNGNNRAGSVYATWNHNDEASGIAWYRITVTPDKDPAVGQSGIQYLGGDTWLGITFNFTKGTIKLTKTSASPEITKANSSYSLAGAIYGVWTTKAQAQLGATSGRVGIITTDANGAGLLGGLELGTYYVKELSASAGFKLDATVYTATTSDGAPVATVSSKEPPAGDPDLIMLQKADADTGGSYKASELPQGSASLAGAEYTVRYYNAQYASVAAAQAATPTRTWVIKTNASGYTTLTSSALVSGDAFYYNEAGDAIIPFGTITIVETKAPTGYILPEPGDANYKVFFTRYVPDASQPGGIRIEGDGNGVAQANAPVHKEQIIRGDIELYKRLVLHEPDSVKPSGTKAPEPGVIFDFYASRDFSGLAPKPGKTPAFFLTTDADGYASTIKADIYLVQNPDGSYTRSTRPATATGGLPYDSYLCVQRTTDVAYEKVSPFVMVVDTPKKTLSQTLDDEVIPAAIRIVKRDSETNKEIPHSATWQIYSEQTQSYVFMDDGTGAKDSFTSDEDGKLLLPQQLPYGNYRLCEVIAPQTKETGYLLSSIDVPFSVTKRHDFDAALVVEMSDVPVKGQIRIEKVNARNKKPVAGATYTITAAEDIYTLDGTLRAKKGEVVATLETDSEGKAQSKELYLGSYTIQETIAPDGFKLDETIHKVKLVYKDQMTAIVTTELELEDEPDELILYKRETLTEKPVPDTEFTLYRESAQGAKDWTAVAVLITDEAGKAVFQPLVKGSYKLVESRPNPLYASAQESGEAPERLFIIDEHSTDEVQVFHNMPIQVSVEVIKDTINITSAAFRTDTDDYLNIDNVGKELYHYDLNFRSTSNVRADEFVLIDPLENVWANQVRIRELFTPVLYGDSDGYFNLWYQTALTDTTKLYSTASAMATNPFNPNNPDNLQNWPSTGWQLWRSDIPTTKTMHLSVDDLGLAPYDYITALRFEFGSVEVGFTSLNAPATSLQEAADAKGRDIDWTPDPATASFSAKAAQAAGLKPATYLVSCPSPLMPPAQIASSVRVFIARNLVLVDQDADAVTTSVIEPFMLAPDSDKPTDISTFEGGGTPASFGFPQTGDVIWAVLESVLGLAALGGGALLIRKRFDKTA
jgi:hypothetical protein